MNARLVILSLGVALVALFLAKRPTPPAMATEPAAPTIPHVAAHARTTNEISARREPPRSESVADPRSQLPEVELKVILQRKSDFAIGQAFNLVADDNALRLDPSIPVLPGTDHAVGVYVSPIREIKTPAQQQEEAFDTIGFAYEFDASPGGLVKFEFRTIAVDEEGEGWSAWREISPEARNTPITLERMAEKWQYRILLAHDPGSNSEIRDIRIVTHQDPDQAAQIFNYATR